VAAEFVALADLLRAPAANVPPQEIAAERDICQLERSTETAHVDTVREAVRDAVRDARLFRARLADAFDDTAARLLRELATDVLARELRLAPCDLAVIVRRAAERAPVVRVRVAPGDVACAAHGPRALAGGTLIGDIPFVADSVLGPGDAIVELEGGALDVRLGVRLAAVLEAFA
jgi:flagellar biosynthesis/type III secretory pathway protein FliH